MANVQFARNSDIKQILSSSDITEMQLNVCIALYMCNSKVNVMSLIQCVRRENPQYKFVDDKHFYTAVYVLQKKGIVVYQ